LLTRNVLAASFISISKIAWGAAAKSQLRATAQQSGKYLRKFRVFPGLFALDHSITVCHGLGEPWVVLLATFRRKYKAS
jgi:hypothetical protein